MWCVIVATTRLKAHVGSLPGRASTVVVSKHGIANRVECQGPRSVTGLREQGKRLPDLRASAWMPGSGRESRALVSRSYERCCGWEEGSRISMMKS